MLYRRLFCNANCLLFAQPCVSVFNRCPRNTDGSTTAKDNFEPNRLWRIELSSRPENQIDVAVVRMRPLRVNNPRRFGSFWPTVCVRLHRACELTRSNSSEGFVWIHSQNYPVL